jgi:hypothetical protein
MRNLTRSVASFSWAMSLFGVEQMANLISPRRAADAFGAVARSAQGVLGPGLRSAFQTGDRLQRSMVDLSFSLVGLGPSANGGGAAATTASGSGSTGASAAASGVLTQAGNLAFELLQLGVSSVYWAAGTAWSQQQGLPGWGPIPPPGTSPQQ